MTEYTKNPEVCSAVIYDGTNASEINDLIQDIDLGFAVTVDVPGKEPAGILILLGVGDLFGQDSHDRVEVQEGQVIVASADRSMFQVLTPEDFEARYTAVPE